MWNKYLCKFRRDIGPFLSLIPIFLPSFLSFFFPHSLILLFSIIILIASITDVSIIFNQLAIWYGFLFSLLLIFVVISYDFINFHIFSYFFKLLKLRFELVFQGYFGFFIQRNSWIERINQRITKKTAILDGNYNRNHKKEKNFILRFIKHIS